MPNSRSSEPDKVRVIVGEATGISMWTAMGAALVGTLLGGMAVWMGLQSRGQTLRDGLQNGFKSTISVHSEPLVERGTPTLAEGGGGGEETGAKSLGGLADAVERTWPSVVCLLWGAPGSKDFVVGAGVIYDARGIVMTNYHVIEPMLRSPSGPGHLRGGKLTARFADGRERAARVLLASQDEDLAVLALLSADGRAPVDEAFSAASFGQSSELRVGETVFAVGCPVGLEHTVSAGIVSALGRTGILPNPHVATIQLDAAINLGNSGGPLFDTTGDLVGITSAKSSSGEGIGFAIPTDRLRVYLQALEAGEHKRSGVIGAVITASPGTKKQLASLPYSTGLTVAEVDKSGPAANAGLREGDVIVEIRGRRHAGDVDSRSARAQYLREFMDVARHLLPRETLTLTAVREGKSVPIEIIVQAASDAEQAALDVEAAFGLRLYEGDKAIVLGLVPGSRLLRLRNATGVLLDHRITHVGRDQIRNLSDLGRVAAKFKALDGEARGRRVFMRLESPEGQSVELAYPLDWRD